ncbi:C2 family cysteine protease [Nocardia altamirensis]|uniref:C2 family cysteine protease n=1 Tax=Nocardia altamirensis TaxID=472158 RepID=UPI00084040CD|nr:ADP-ribosyltransferase [Nocardia altamirensis]
MTITMPPWLEWVSYLAGSEWPKGDEDQLFGLGDDWKRASSELRAIIPDLKKAADITLLSYDGDGADAMRADFDTYFKGDTSIESLAKGLADLGDYVRNCGTQIEYSKLQIITTLAITAAEIAWALSTLFGSAAVPAIQTAAQIATRTIFQRMLDAILRLGTRFVGQSFMKKLGITVVVETAIGLGQELGIQAYQVGRGRRDNIDWKQVGIAAATSAAGSAVAFPVAHRAGTLINKWAGPQKSMWGAGLRAAAAAVPAGLAGVGGGFVAGGILTGEWQFDPRMLGGAIGGALSGSVSGVTEFRSATRGLNGNPPIPLSLALREPPPSHEAPPLSHQSVMTAPGSDTTPPAGARPNPASSTPTSPAGEHRAATPPTPLGDGSSSHPNSGNQSPHSTVPSGSATTTPVSAHHTTTTTTAPATHSIDTGRPITPTAHDARPASADTGPPARQTALSDTGTRQTSLASDTGTGARPAGTTPETRTPAPSTTGPRTGLPGEPARSGTTPTRAGIGADVHTPGDRTAPLTARSTTEAPTPIRSDTERSVVQGNSPSTGPVPHSASPPGETRPGLPGAGHATPDPPARTTTPPNDGSTRKVAPSGELAGSSRAPDRSMPTPDNAAVLHGRTGDRTTQPVRSPSRLPTTPAHLNKPLPPTPPDLHKPVPSTPGDSDVPFALTTTDPIPPSHTVGDGSFPRPHTNLQPSSASLNPVHTEAPGTTHETTATHNDPTSFPPTAHLPLTDADITALVEHWRPLLEGPPAQTISASKRQAVTVANEWKKLSAQQQNALIEQLSRAVGDSQGIPATDRDRANRLVISRQLDELRAKDRLTGLEKQQLRNLEDTAQRLTEFDEIARSMVTKESGTPPKVHVLHYDATAFNGLGRAVISIGDVDTAHSVSWHVGGVGNNVLKLGRKLGQAANHYLQTVRHLESGQSAASVVWLGYEHPQLPKMGKIFGSLHDIATSGLAKKGGELLARDIATFNAVRGNARGAGTPAEHKNYLFAHSYGSTVTSYAGEGGRLRHEVGAITLLGSPGTGPQRYASDFGLRDNKVYVVSSAWDVFTQLGTGRQGFRNLIPLAGLGIDPSTQGFGAARLHTGYPSGWHSANPLGPHARYYDFHDADSKQPTASLDSFAKIAAGQEPDTSKLGRRDAVPIFDATRPRPQQITQPTGPTDPEFGETYFGADLLAKLGAEPTGTTDPQRTSFSEDGLRPPTLRDAELLPNLAPADRAALHHPPVAVRPQGDLLTLIDAHGRSVHLLNHAWIYAIPNYQGTQHFYDIHLPTSGPGGQWVRLPAQLLHGFTFQPGAVGYPGVLGWQVPGGATRFIDANTNTLVHLPNDATYVAIPETGTRKWIKHPGTTSWHLIDDRAGMLPMPATAMRHDDPLFGAKGPKPEDVRQGTSGDCYLLADLKNLATHNPDSITEIIHDHGDGTVSVRFSTEEAPGRPPRPVWVRVEKQIYVDPVTGRAKFAGHEPGGPLWPAMIEKAYALHFGKGLGFHGINGGLPGATAGKLGKSFYQGSGDGFQQPVRAIDDTEFLHPMSFDVDTLYEQIGGDVEFSRQFVASRDDWVLRRDELRADTWRELNQLHPNDVSTATSEFMAFLSTEDLHTPEGFRGYLDERFGSRWPAETNRLREFMLTALIGDSQNRHMSGFTVLAESIADRIQYALDRGTTVSLSTHQFGDGRENTTIVPGLVGTHAYSVVGIERDANGRPIRVLLENPWNHNGQRPPQPIQGIEYRTDPTAPTRRGIVAVDLKHLPKFQWFSMHGAGAHGLYGPGLAPAGSQIAAGYIHASSTSETHSAPTTHPGDGSQSRPGDGQENPAQPTGPTYPELGETYFGADLLAKLGSEQTGTTDPQRTTFSEEGLLPPTLSDAELWHNLAPTDREENLPFVAVDLTGDKLTLIDADGWSVRLPNDATMPAESKYEGAQHFYDVDLPNGQQALLPAELLHDFTFQPDAGGPSGFLSWRVPGGGTRFIDQNTNAVVHLPNDATYIATPETGTLKWIKNPKESAWHLIDDADDVLGMPIVAVRHNDPLFGAQGPKPEDVRQGESGDCYLLADLKNLAAHNPDSIAEIIHDHGDGTVSVRFFTEETPGEPPRPEWVRVEKRIYVDPDNEHGWFAGHAPGDPLWPAMIEKAYAQHFGNGLGFHGIDGGFAGETAGQLGKGFYRSPGGGFPQPVRTIDDGKFLHPMRFDVDTLHQQIGGDLEFSRQFVASYDDWILSRDKLRDDTWDKLEQLYPNDDDTVDREYDIFLSTKDLATPEGLRSYLDKQFGDRWSAEKDRVEEFVHTALTGDSDNRNMGDFTVLAESIADRIQYALNRGTTVSLSTHQFGDGRENTRIVPGLVGGHAYSVVGIEHDANGRPSRVLLENPWNDNGEYPPPIPGIEYRTYPEGSTYWAKADGTRYRKDSDGTQHTTFPDGQRFREDPDGTKTWIEPNGDTSRRDPDGTYSEDGTQSEIGPDPTVETRRGLVAVDLTHLPKFQYISMHGAGAHGLYGPNPPSAAAGHTNASPTTSGSAHPNAPHPATPHSDAEHTVIDHTDPNPAAVHESTIANVNEPAGTHLALEPVALHFDTNDAGDQYGEKVLGPIRDSVPARDFDEAHRYTVDSWINHPLRTGDIHQWVKDITDDHRHYTTLLSLTDEPSAAKLFAIREEAISGLRPALTDAQQDSIRVMFEDGNPDRRIDQAKKNSDKHEQLTRWLNDRPPTAANLTEHRDALDRALSRSLPEPVVVVRGVTSAKYMRLGDGLLGAGDPMLLKGTVQIETGYMSTSLGATPPTGFHGAIRLELEVPDKSTALWMGPRSAYPKERELILPRGTRYLITDVVKTPAGERYDGVQYLIKGRVVPTAAPDTLRPATASLPDLAGGATDPARAATDLTDLGIEPTSGPNLDVGSWQQHQLASGSIVYHATSADAARNIATTGIRTVQNAWGGGALGSGFYTHRIRESAENYVADHTAVTLEFVVRDGVTGRDVPEGTWLGDHPGLDYVSGNSFLRSSDDPDEIKFHGGSALRLVAVHVNGTRHLIGAWLGPNTTAHPGLIAENGASTTVPTPAAVDELASTGPFVDQLDGIRPPVGQWKSMPGEGDCLFHALSESMGMGTDGHTDLRARLADELHLNRRHFLTEFQRRLDIEQPGQWNNPHHVDTEYTRQIESLLNQGEYRHHAGNFLLPVAAQVLQLNLLILHPDGHITRLAHGQTPDQPFTILYRENANGGHYHLATNPDNTPATIGPNHPLLTTDTNPTASLTGGATRNGLPDGPENRMLGEAIDGPRADVDTLFDGPENEVFRRLFDEPTTRTDPPLDGLENEVLGRLFHEPRTDVHTLFDGPENEVLRGLFDEPRTDVDTLFDTTDDLGLPHLFSEVVRFPSNDQGEAYGEHTLGPIRDSLPPAEFGEAHRYTVNSWVNYPLRTGDLGHWVTNLSNERARYDTLFTVDNSEPTHYSLYQAYTEAANGRRTLTPEQDQAIVDILRDPAPDRRLAEVRTTAETHWTVSNWIGGPVTVDNMNAHVTWLDQAVAHHLPEPVEVVRGMRDVSFLRVNGAVLGTGDPRTLLGTVQIEPGYMSTSLGATPPAHFDGAIRMELELPPGASGLWMGVRSAYPDQRELILPRGTRYLVTEVIQNPQDPRYAGVQYLIRGRVELNTPVVYVPPATPATHP